MFPFLLSFMSCVRVQDAEGTKIDPWLSLVSPVKLPFWSSFCKDCGKHSLGVLSTSWGHQDDLHVVRQFAPLLDVQGQIWSPSFVNGQRYQLFKEQLAWSRLCAHATAMHYVCEANDTGTPLRHCLSIEVDTSELKDRRWILQQKEKWASRRLHKDCKCLLKRNERKIGHCSIIFLLLRHEQIGGNTNFCLCIKYISRK